LVSSGSGVHSERLVVKAETGNVGIGTTSPVNKLDVNGSVAIGTYAGNNTAPANGLMTSGNVYVARNTDVGHGNYKLQVGGDMITTGNIRVDGNTINLPGTGLIYFAGDASGPLIQATASYFRFNTYSNSKFAFTGGNVGIGTTNAGYKLQVGDAGDGTEARANAWNSLSDSRFKENVVVISGGLDKIMQLEGVSFDWKSNGKKSVGLIAQDVQKVFPELVSVDENGILSLNYAGLSAPIIEAIQEQQLNIEELMVASQAESLTQIEEREWNELSTLVNNLKILVNSLVTRLSAIETAFANLTDSFFTREATVETLCVGTADDRTCLSKEQVDQIIETLPATDLDPATPEPSEPTPEPSAEPSPEPSATPSEAVAEPAVEPSDSTSP